MCYSAMVEQDAKKYGLRYKARVQTDLYDDLFRRRAEGEKLLINKAMELPFLTEPANPTERRIAESIRAWRKGQIQKFETLLFEQKTRLTEATRKLETKPTKKAETDKRVATNKIETAKRKIKEIESPELSDTDLRIFPFHYMSMVHLDGRGEKVVSPVRYHMRPHDEDASFDKEKDGCYNARFDNLKRVSFWKDSLSTRRGFILVKKFYENVPVEKYLRHNKLGPEHQGKKNIVLCFDPKLPDYMILPTVWDDWSGPGEPSFRSAALITDDPHPEVEAAGHDRTPIPLNESAAEAWLHAASIDEALTILKEERERPYFSHLVMGAA